jgi:hypothetical protein
METDVTNAAIIALRVLLVLMGLGLLAAQVVLIPLLAAEAARIYPEVAYLQQPFTIVAMLILVCGEVVLVCIWLLLSRVRVGEIFSSRAFPVVDTVIIALLVAGSLFAGLFLYMQLFVRNNNPGMALIMVGGGFATVSLALLVYVMRSLLKRATELEHDLSEVV